MAHGRWRWKKTTIIVEAAIIGTTVALLIILFTETGVERQRDSVDASAECPIQGC